MHIAFLAGDFGFQVVNAGLVHLGLACLQLGRSGQATIELGFQLSQARLGPAQLRLQNRSGIVIAHLLLSAADLRRFWPSVHRGCGATAGCRRTWGAATTTAAPTRMHNRQRAALDQTTIFFFRLGCIVRVLIATAVHPALPPAGRSHAQQHQRTKKLDAVCFHHSLYLLNFAYPRTHWRFARTVSEADALKAPMSRVSLHEILL